MKSVFLITFLALLLCQQAHAATCSPANTFIPGNGDSWSGWGGNPGNTRQNSSINNPVTAANLERLNLKWAYGFENVQSVISNPGLHGNRIFIGDENGRFYSLDRDSGCEDWIFQAGNGIRTAPSLANINGNNRCLP